MQVVTSMLQAFLDKWTALNLQVLDFCWAPHWYARLLHTYRHALFICLYSVRLQCDCLVRMLSKSSSQL